MCKCSRILPIEQKFFCDRATEKTVTIWVSITVILFTNAWIFLYVHIM